MYKAYFSLSRKADLTDMFFYLNRPISICLLKRACMYEIYVQPIALSNKGIKRVP